MQTRDSTLQGSIPARLRTAERLCIKRGKRLTPIRRQILQILLEQHRSIKAYELLEQIRATNPGAAPPTVYRALDFLVEQGLAHRLDATNAWTACHDADGAPHDLLVVCTECGVVAEVSDPSLTQQIASKVAQTGFTLSAHETELRALCRHCHT